MIPFQKVPKSESKLLFLRNTRDVVSWGQICEIVVSWACQLTTLLFPCKNPIIFRPIYFSCPPPSLTHINHVATVDCKSSLYFLSLYESEAKISQIRALPSVDVVWSQIAPDGEPRISRSRPYTPSTNHESVSAVNRDVSANVYSIK